MVFLFVGGYEGRCSRRVLRGVSFWGWILGNFSLVLGGGILVEDIEGRRFGVWFLIL